MTHQATNGNPYTRGIAGTQASGLMAAQFGSMVKRMHAGRAAQSGLYGALLAEAGFTGIVNVFESEYGGFCTTFSRSTDRYKLDELTAGLGSVWQTMGVALKFYSCVGSNHSTLDAIRELQRERPFGAGDVAKIVVHGSQVTMDHAGTAPGWNARAKSRVPKKTSPPKLKWWRNSKSSRPTCCHGRRSGSCAMQCSGLKHSTMLHRSRT